MNGETPVRPVEILLVESNSDCATHARKTLRDANVWNNLSVVSDGESALEFLRHSKRHREAPLPDVILVDLYLPGRQGRQVVDAIKDSAEWSGIPVVMMTASAAVQDALRCSGLRADGYVNKPVGHEQLAAEVNRIGGKGLVLCKPAFG